jgi:hypothetical protein
MHEVDRARSTHRKTEKFMQICGLNISRKRQHWIPKITLKYNIKLDSREMGGHNWLVCSFSECNSLERISFA